MALISTSAEDVRAPRRSWPSRLSRRKPQRLQINRMVRSVRTDRRQLWPNSRHRKCRPGMHPFRALGLFAGAQWTIHPDHSIGASRLGRRRGEDAAPVGGRRSVVGADRTTGLGARRAGRHERRGVARCPQSGMVGRLPAERHGRAFARRAGCPDFLSGAASPSRGAGPRRAHRCPRQSVCADGAGPVEATGSEPWVSFRFCWPSTL